MRALPAWMLLLSSLLAAPADAAFHLMKVREVFGGGSAAGATAQYVQLQMYFPGQSVVGGHSVILYDATGTAVGSATFGASVANGASQSMILIATADAQSYFSVTADLSVPSTVDIRAGGKACFDLIDCVAWGSYAGADVGTPLAGGTPFAGGIPDDQAIHRRLDVFGSPTLLEASDDTNNSNNDFAVATPAPTNNAGQVGGPPQPPQVPALPSHALPLGLALLIASSGAFLIRRRATAGLPLEP